jgi:hypothetical protein
LQKCIAKDRRTVNRGTFVALFLCKRLAELVCSCYFAIFEGNIRSKKLTIFLQIPATNVLVYAFKKAVLNSVTQVFENKSRYVEPEILTAVFTKNYLLGFAVMQFGESEWSRRLRHELSSLARTLGSWVLIPIKAQMSVFVYSMFVLFFV